ncbi:MAG: response regulator [Rubrivivax sp.]|nr:response regulator [Rubrivivax sp.]
MTASARVPAGTPALARRLLWWLVVPVGLLLAVLTAQQFAARSAEAERELGARVDERMQVLAELARPAAEHVQDLRRLLEEHWREPPDPGPALRRALRPRAGGDGWAVDPADTAAQQRFGQLWWAPVDGRAPDEAWLRRARVFLDVARIVHAREPGFEATWFAAAEDNLSFGYPWVDTARMLASMGVADLRGLDVPRQAGVARAEKDLAADPEDTDFWGVPYVSQLHGELVLSHGSAVIVDGRYRGEVSLDFRIDTLQRLALRWQADDSQVWIVERGLVVLADASEALRAPPGQGLADTRVSVPLATRLAARGIPVDEALLDRLVHQRGQLSHVGDWVIASASREGLPWIVVEALPRSTLQAPVWRSLLPNALLGGALLAVFVLGQWLFARWFVTPAVAVLAYLRQLAADPAAPVPRLGRRWQGWVDAVTDTFRRQREASDQIERQREALRQSEKLSAMGSLLAGVAHELNNPLAIAMGRASLLEEKVAAGAEPGALQDDARRIREAAERCGRIVRTFLNMARQRPPSRRAVQLDDIVRAATDMLGYTLRSHGVRVDLALGEGLPDVQADADQIGQVVLNLMVNAQQAMEGAATLTRVLSISTGVELPRPGREPRVWLRVADTGPGVPVELHERLFEPFFTTKAVGLGTGLGLSVSRGIVREHGGDLVLEQPRDSDGVAAPAGASFRLSLPISGEKSADGDVQAATPSDTSDAEAAAGELRRVLVVDDEPEVAELMREVLESAGFDVLTAESGAVALELLAGARFDAVVSDVRMPDLDGPALWQRLQAEHPALARRMLFVSGDTLSDAARQTLADTGAATLDKPFTSTDLLGAVRAVLDDQGSR